MLIDPKKEKLKSPMKLKNKRNTNPPKVERTKLQEIGLGV
jgi:hypothetical protein